MSSEVQIGAPNLSQVTPQALAVANFLRHNRALKQRQGIYKGKRHDFFRVKRALRALESPEYKKRAATNGSNLPAVENKEQAIAALRLLPLNKLAFRVRKLETKEALQTNQKPVYGTPVLDIMQQQDFEDDMYYIWFHEPIQTVTYIYAALALVAVFAIVLFPLWPVKMRIGVWYLSMGVLGLMGLFFAIAILRLILFTVTFVVAKPGLWIFPNLFEDVGFIESFIPLYAWHGQKVLTKPERRKKNPNKEINLGLSAKEKAAIAGQQVPQDPMDQIIGSILGRMIQSGANPAAIKAVETGLLEAKVSYLARWQTCQKQSDFPSTVEAQNKIRAGIINEEIKKVHEKGLALQQEELRRRQEQQL